MEVSSFRQSLIKEVRTADEKMDTLNIKKSLSLDELKDQTFIRGYRMGLIWALQTLAYYEKKDMDNKLDGFDKVRAAFEGGFTHANHIEKNK